MEIKRDQFLPINLGEGGPEVMVNAKYDRIDAFPDVTGEIGYYVLKMFDDEAGLISASVDGETVEQITMALITRDMEPLPIVERRAMFESEREGYLATMSDRLEDDMFDLDDIDEEAIIREETEEE